MLEEIATRFDPFGRFPEVVARVSFLNRLRAGIITASCLPVRRVRAMIENPDLHWNLRKTNMRPLQRVLEFSSFLSTVTVWPAENGNSAWMRKYKGERYSERNRPIGGTSGPRNVRPTSVRVPT